MKKKFHLGGIAALTLLGSFATSQAQTATTTPVGYTTETLQQGFNLIGLTLHQPTIASGAFESVSASSVTDTDITFTDASVLDASGSATYILEITSGALAGSIQDITAWSANALTTPDDLLAAGLLAGDTYTIRKASTLSDIFGSNNESGLEGGASATVADTISVPTASGFDSYYYSTGGFFGVGWRKVGAGSTDQANLPLIYTDAFYINRKSETPLDLVVTGSVKVTDTSVYINDSFAYISTSYPAGTTLSSSGIQDDLTGGASSTVADNVILPADGGTFDYYYYSTGGFFGVGWRKVGAGSTDQSSVPMTSGFIIQRSSGNDFNLSINSPVN